MSLIGLLVLVIPVQARRDKFLCFGGPRSRKSKYQLDIKLSMIMGFSDIGDVAVNALTNAKAGSFIDETGFLRAKGRKLGAGNGTDLG
jgi:hypothetical protein